MKLQEQHVAQNVYVKNIRRNLARVLALSCGKLTDSFESANDETSAKFSFLFVMLTGLLVCDIRHTQSASYLPFHIYVRLGINVGCGGYIVDAETVQSI